MEWVSLFSERVFVMLRVYADESETQATAICGYIASPDYWKEFSRKWKTILDDFGAPYFHFREFTTKELYSKAGNAYYNWSEKKRDRFLYALAILASESAIPIGGGFGQSKNENPEPPEKKWENSIIKLFQDLTFVLNTICPNYKGRISFVFDHCEDKKKVVPILETHALFSSKDPRFGGITFEDDKDPMHLPLQAADLISYVNRQFIEKMFSKDERQTPDIRMLDFILMRNRVEKLRNMNIRTWRRFVAVLRKHQIETVKEWKRKGINQAYYPDIHFPFENYGNKNRKPV